MVDASLSFDGLVPATVSELPARAAEPRAAVPGPRPWTLPRAGLVVFHGSGEVARLSHYFLPRLIQEGRRVLVLDGANSADPRLLERFARERGVAFEAYSRHIQIARAFTCFQLTELIRRVPRFLHDFPARVLIVTAFPDLYFDEDVRDWDARVAFQQALVELRRDSRFPVPDSRDLPLAVAVFSAAADFTPSRPRRRFFSEVSAAAAEVWKFGLDETGRARLACERRALPGPREEAAAGLKPAAGR